MTAVAVVVFAIIAFFAAATVVHHVDSTGIQVPCHDVF